MTTNAETAVRSAKSEIYRFPLNRVRTSLCEEMPVRNEADFRFVWNAGTGRYDITYESPRERDLHVSMRPDEVMYVIKHRGVRLVTH